MSFAALAVGWWGAPRAPVLASRLFPPPARCRLSAAPSCPWGLTIVPVTRDDLLESNPLPAPHNVT